MTKETMKAVEVALATAVAQTTGNLVAAPVDDSFAALIADLAGDMPVPEVKGKPVVTEASPEEIEKVCPELLLGLLQPDGTAWPGALLDTVVDGQPAEFGDVGTTYICRLINATPAICQYIKNHHGAANRTPTPARLKEYEQYMLNDEWRFVWNTAVFTSTTAANKTSVGLEQHNCNHSMTGAIATGKTIKVLMCFGVPKSQRDKIDNNLARTAKDIVSTRVEMQSYFAVGKVIGGSVAIDKTMSAAMNRSVAETFRIVDDIRSGKQAKTGGARSKTDMGEKLDTYTDPICKAVSGFVALDSRCNTTTVSKDGSIKPKLGGGLSRRIAVNHGASILTLGATYIRKDGSLGYDDHVANQILRCYAELGNEKLTDTTNPMVSLRTAIDRWKTEDLNKGGSGMNVRFIALKMAVLWRLSGQKVVNQGIWDAIKPTDGKNLNLSGLGSNPDAAGGIVGIDDYVDPTEAAMAASQNAAGTVDSAVPLIPEDE